RIDPDMRIEPAILDRDKRFRQVRRQILQRDIGAGHFTTHSQHAAIETDNLDRGWTLWNFQRLDRGQMRANPDYDANYRDPGPQTEHRAPVKQPIERATSPALAAASAARF